MTTKKAASTSKSTKPTAKKPKAESKKKTTRQKTAISKPSTPKPEDAVKSLEFQQAKNKAEEYARDPEKTKKLIDEAMKKAKGKNKGPLAEVWNYLTTFFRLILAFYNKRYKDVPWQSIILVIAAIIYFVSPIDLLPDFIPVMGYFDDVAIISFVAASIKVDLDNFIEWEDFQRMQEDESEE